MTFAIEIERDDKGRLSACFYPMAEEGKSYSFTNEMTMYDINNIGEVPEKVKDFLTENADDDGASVGWKFSVDRSCESCS